MAKIKFQIHPDLVGVVPEIKPATKFVPDWYKDMPMTTQSLEEHNAPNIKIAVDVPMMKRCLPVRDYLTSGYIIPYWSETLLRKSSKGHYVDLLASNPDWISKYNIGVDWHNIKQIKNSPLEELSDGEKVIKLSCPWTIATPKGYSTLFFSPFYHENDVTILPAIVDTDTHVVPTNFPAIIMGEEVKIEMGAPIIQAIPFKRETWTSEIITSTNDEVVKQRRLYPLISSFTSHYTKNLWRRKYFR